MADQRCQLFGYCNAVVLILLKSAPGIIDFLSVQCFFCPVLFHFSKKIFNCCSP